MSKKLTYADIDYDRVTPMMRQYLDTKKAHPDCILFFRLGDFYEMFFDDALTVSQELELTLTQKSCGLDEPAPMCGVPYHAAQTYLDRLLKKGYKVAIGEQVEDPVLAKGLVERKVTEVVTPGTVMEPGSLEAKKDNYLVAIYAKGTDLALAYADLSSGLLKACAWENLSSRDQPFQVADLQAELTKLSPTELLLPEDIPQREAFTRLAKDRGMSLTFLPASLFSWEKARDFPLPGMEEKSLRVLPAAALLSYIVRCEDTLPAHITQVDPFDQEEYLILDAAAAKGLEVYEPLNPQPGKSSSSVFIKACDHCVTGMGSRLFKRWVDRPLRDRTAILDRQAAARAFADHFILRQTFREDLRGICDFERLAGRIAVGKVTPAELVTLKHGLDQLRTLRENALGALPQAASATAGLAEKLADQPVASDPIAPLRSRLETLVDLKDLRDLLEDALVEDAPNNLTSQATIIKDSFHEELFSYRDMLLHGKTKLLDLEQAEKEKSGLTTLKLVYNRVFGYCFEVSKSYVDQVPPYFIRKQTLRNAERYFTEDLKDLENKILGAKEKADQVERALWQDLKDQVREYLLALKTYARILAELDLFSSFAEMAASLHYSFPKITEDKVFHLVGARHPVVEAALPPGTFVANNLDLTPDQSLMILTGPNMGGKSTYMRQAALIVILAQIGAPVPAQEATIGICDRILTRIGSSDDLAGGRSTFMVEMSEMSNILKQMTESSFLIIDEIGRGTGTWDGLSLAQAILEYLGGQRAYTPAPRTIFATHYHELTDIVDQIPKAFHAHVEADREGDTIRFLHSVSLGKSYDSFGTEVAQLAGLPRSIIRRAQRLRERFAAESSKSQANLALDYTYNEGLNLTNLVQAKEDQESWVNLRAELEDLDLNTLRPLDALAKLSDWQARYGGQGHHEGGKP